jgi:hypothetical protein
LNLHLKDRLEQRKLIFGKKKIKRRKETNQKHIHQKYEPTGKNQRKNNEKTALSPVFDLCLLIFCSFSVSCFFFGFV